MTLRALGWDVKPRGSGAMLGPSMPKEEMTMKAKNSVLTSDTATRAAERLLERKRMGLESAIEALETVGYAVTVDADGAIGRPYPWPTLPRRRACLLPWFKAGSSRGIPICSRQLTTQRYPA